MAQKVIKKVGRPKAPATKDQEIEKIETVQVDKPSEKIRPVKRRRNLHPVEVNGVVRMLTKFAYNSIKKDRTKEIILPKDSPFNELENCEGC